MERQDMAATEGEYASESPIYFFVGLCGYLQRLAQAQTILVIEACIIEGNFNTSIILPDLLE